MGATDRGTAVKALDRQAPYRRERDVYRRLLERDMVEVCGCAIPRLIDFDDELWCIEMTVVTAPYVLDFASAYLDRAPDFSQEMTAYWRAEKRELFGARWPEIQRIVGALAHVGILLFDLSPSNIRLDP